MYNGGSLMAPLSRSCRISVIKRLLLSMCISVSFPVILSVRNLDLDDPA
jgi:hypothetical protein